MGVLSVVEHQVLHSQFLSQHTGVKGRAVAFLVGVEHKAVLVQAEGLAHQPVAAAGIGLALHAVRLVTQADKALAVRKFSLKSILLDFGRCDVKECHLHVINVDGLTVVHLLQDDRLPDRIKDLARNHQFAHGVQGVAHHVVAVDREGPLMLTLEDHRRNLAHQPDGAQDVVGVAVRNEHVADALKGDVRLDELLQDAVAAPAVHQHAPLGAVQIEAGVVAVDAHGVAGAQHGDA